MEREGVMVGVMVGVMGLGLDADQDLGEFAPVIAGGGIGVVWRYLKNLTVEEVETLHTAGLLVGMIFETTARRALEGAEAGAEDGTRALQQAQALGAPEAAAIYATMDGDVVNDDDLAAVAAYAAAFKASLFRAARFGFYGSGLVLSSIVGVDLPWLAGAMSWSGSRDFLAAGGSAVVQGPTLSVGGPWAPPGFPAIHWPDLGFAYDPDVLLVSDVGVW